MRKPLILLLLLCLMANACRRIGTASNAPPTSEPTPQAGVWNRRADTDSRYEVMRYALFLPPDYDPQRKYPLVLWFHGAGSRGDDLDTLLKDSDQHGIGYLSRPDIQKQYPAIILAPQLRNGRGWGARRSGPQPSDINHALAIFDATRQSYAVDNKRVYVMGVSMGGFATWYALAQRPEVFAAGVPICGGGDESQAVNFKNIPVWAFHGAQDDTVSVEFSRRMIDALKAAGGQPKYTEYPDVGHRSWENAFQEKDLLPWLYAQRKP